MKDNFSDVHTHFGRVLYTHGLKMDRPLSVVRFNYADQQGSSNAHTLWPTFTIVPLWDSRGQPDLGTFGDGGAHHCSKIDGETRCVLLEWPAGWSAYAKQRYANLPREYWHGSLLEEKKDYAGTFYRRNRYYDPATGRFTQEDPIGLAGGLNLYGFASGDPVNLSDPFGLCPWCEKKFQELANYGAQQSGLLGEFALNTGAAGNALLAASGISDLGNAIEDREVVGGIIALAGLLPVGKLAKGAKLLKNVDGGALSVDEALDAGVRWLGEGYTEIGSGVFRSADNARQCRISPSNLTGDYPHVNFEALAEDGREILQNAQVRILDP